MTTAANAATAILKDHPNLKAFYANNDGMALGVVEAVKAAGKAEQVAVFGTDGISDAYAAVRAGDLTGTVDSFPVLTGEIAMEVALRLMAGQDLPRVVGGTKPGSRVTAQVWRNKASREVQVMVTELQDDPRAARGGGRGQKPPPAAAPAAAE